MKKIMTAVAAACLVTFAQAAATTQVTTHLKLDNRTGTRIAAASETINYSPYYGYTDGTAAVPGSCTVKVDGTTLKTATEAGSVVWSPTGVGYHTLTHTAGNVTLNAAFTVLGSDVAIHDGTLATSETWSDGQVHLVTADVTVPSGKTLTIAPGVIVKFMDGTSLTVASGGSCTAKGVIFTHVNDDTAGGDTLMDGDAIAPVFCAYSVNGVVVEDDATEYRHVSTVSSVPSTMTWVSNRVYVVSQPITVSSGVALTIQPGTVVKFLSGASLTVASGGSCTAKGVIFTHVNDDTVGGDTLMDGDETQPVAGAYSVNGNVIDDDATEYRYAPPQTLTANVSGTVNLRGHRVYIASNSVTVASGATLNLKPGTIIKFASGCSMTVNGTLNAQGTRAAPIVFTSLKDDAWGGDTNGDGEKTYAQAGDWATFYVYSGARVLFDNVKVLYGGKNSSSTADVFYLSGGNISFKNSELNCVYQYCVGLESGTWTMENSIFRDFYTAFRHFASCTCVNSVFYDFDYLSNNGGQTFKNCVIAKYATALCWWTDNCTYKNCVIFNPNGFGPQSSDKVGSNGNIWGDPLFLDPDNGDFRISPASLCVDAGDGSVAPTTDYYGSPRMDVKKVKDTGVPNGDGVCPDIGIYEVPVTAPIPLPDLAVLSVTAPATTRAGEEIAVTYVVTNRGASCDGLARDAVAFVAEEAALGGQRVSAGAVEQAYSLASNGVVRLTARVTVPSLKAGVWRLSVTANAERDLYEQVTANNAGKAAGTTTVSLPAIDAAAGQVTLEAGENVYEVTALPAAGGTVILTLPAGATAFGANGYVPGAERSDAVAVDLGGGRLALVFPARGEETKAYLAIEAAAGGSASVEVVETELALYGASPARLVNKGTVHLTLAGSLLDGAEVSLVGTETLAATRVEKIDGAHVCATFAPNAAKIGRYSVRVTAGGKTVTLDDAVELYKTTTGPKLEARLVLPNSVRDGRVYAAYVEYANTGDEDADLPIFTVSRRDGGTTLALTAKGDYSAEPLSLIGLSPSAPRGTLKPGESGRVTFFLLSNGTISLRLSQVTDSSSSVLNGFASAAAYRAGMSAAATRLCARGAGDPGFSEVLAQALNEARGAGGAAVCGTLLHAVTRLPLAGYALTLVSTNDDSVVAATVSGDDGSFALATTEKEACRVDVSNTLSCEDAGVFVLDDRDYTEVTVAAVPGSTVSGIAYAAPTAEVVPEAKIVLDNVATEALDDYSATADLDGHYSFSGLKDGDYELWAYPCEGWCAVRSGVFTVTNGAVYVVDSAYAERGTRVVGRVVDADTGAAVTNGAVAFVPEAGGDAFCSLLDSEGNYELAALPAGNYTVKSVGGEYDVDDAGCTVDGSALLTRNVTFRRGGAFTTLQPIGMAPHRATFSLMTEARNPRWDFDGDGVVDSTDDEPSWTFDAVGTHAVSLTYVDTNGIERVCRDPKAVEVVAQIENKAKAGNVVLTASSPVTVVEVGSERLVVRGSEAATWGVGTVVGMESGACGGFIVRIRSAAESTGDGSYAFDVEPTTPDDLFETYFIAHEFSFGAEEIKPVLLKAAARLAAASPNESAKSDLNINVEISKFKPLVYKFGGKIVVTTDPVQGSQICYKDSSGHKVSQYRIKKCYQFSVPMSVSNTKDVGKQFEWSDSLYGPGIWGPWGLYFSVDCDYGVTAGVKAKGTLSFEPELTVTTLNEFKEVDGKKSESVLDRSFGGVGCSVTLSGSISAEVEPYFGIGVFASWLKVVGRVGGGVKIGVTLGAEQDVSLAANLNRHDIESGVALDSSLKVTSSLWATLYGSAGLIRYHCANGLQKKLQISGDLPYKLSWDGEASVGKIDFDCSGDGLTVSFSEKQPRIEAEGFLFGSLDGKPVGTGMEFWSFGDWSFGSGRTATHTYGQKGEYTVTHSAVCELPGSLLNLMDGFVKVKRRKIKVFDDKPPEPQDPIDDDNRTPAKSCDPNEMAGPAGKGENRLVKPGAWMDYTVYFENKADADVAAQEVFVDAQLGEWLDWSTFEMGEVAFNNQNETGLSGLKNGLKTVAQVGADYKVQMSVELDETTGAVRWYLRSYDPNRADYGCWPASVDAGFLPPNDDSHRGEGHITYRVKVREDAPFGVRIDAAATIVFDRNDSIETDPAWWNTVGHATEEVEAGDYAKWTMEELGFQVPTDGSAYGVSALGLPSGLRLVKSPAVTKKVKDKKTGKTKTVVVTPAGASWWIEGVASAAQDFLTRPCYLTVTAGGTNYTAAVALDVAAQNVVDLGELPLGVAVTKTDWLPGATTGWTVSGLPAGLKYSGDRPLVTKKLVNKAKKLYSVTTNVPAFTVHGTPSKAGLYAVTAKKPVNGFYETLKYRVLVTPKAVDATLFGAALTNLTTTAYEPFAWNLADGTRSDGAAAVVGACAKVAGLPTGLAFAAQSVYGYANATKKTGKYLKQAAQTIVGTPTKAGTSVVTFTKNVKSGKKTVAQTAQILWTVAPNPETPTLAFNELGGAVLEGNVGVASAGLVAFAAGEGATVTASGLPAGVTLVDLGGGRWGFTGATTKAGVYLVTVKATVKGNAVAQRLALRVAALPAWARGTFDGGTQTGDVGSGVARLSVGTTGKISGTLREHGTNWTLSAACYTGFADGAYACTNVVAKYAYKTTQTVKGKKQTVTKTLTRRFAITVTDGATLGTRTCAQVVGAEVSPLTLSPLTTSFIAYPNEWAGAYKAIGQKLFYQSKKVPYRTYAYTAAELPAALAEGETLTLKIAPAGAVTATLAHPTGKKDKKTKKEIVYKATASTTLVPTTPASAGAEGFRGGVHLHFPASSANGFAERVFVVEPVP